MPARRFYVWIVIGGATLASACSSNSSAIRTELLKQSGGAAIELTETPYSSEHVNREGL